MANANSTQSTKSQPFTFQDAQGALVSIPREEIIHYAAIRAEQVSTLTNLIHDQVAGNQIELSSIDLTLLAGLANELAHTSKAIAFEVAAKGAA
jgi:hypothetical protein